MVAKRPSVRWIRSSLPGSEAGLRSSAGHTATGEQVERSKQLNHWQKRTLRLIRDCRTAAQAVTWTSVRAVPTCA